MNLSAWAIKNQALVLFFIILFSLGGFVAYNLLSEKEDPDFPFNTMVVTAGWPGATAFQVQRQVLERIEKRLQDLPSLKAVRSYARPGSAVIYVELNEGTSKQQASESFYQVRKKIGDLKRELPSELRGPFFNDEFGDVYGSIYAITGDGFDYEQLKDYADAIRLQLLSLPDVAKVNIIGEQDQKIYVEFSHIKIATLGIDPEAIISTIRDQNALQPAGLMRSSNEEIVLRPTGNFDSLDNIQNLNIHTASGDFSLGDVANIYRSYEDPPSFKIRYKGEEALGLAISMTNQGNIITLGKTLATYMEGVIAKLPVGIEIHQLTDQPAVVNHAIHGFMHSLLEAVIIIILVSFVSLGMRAGLVVTLSIPLVLCMTFLVMYFFGQDLQRVSLGAMIIALGLLVDDAMISTEMMLRKLEEGFDKVNAVTFAYTSTAFPMLSGTLITIAGFMPIGLAKSDAGTYTFSLFSVVTISLLVSWIVAVIFSPYFGYHLLKKPKQEHHQQTSKILTKVHHAVEYCVDHHKLVLLVTLAVFLVSLFCFKFVEHQFFPESERPEVIINMTLPEGSTYNATEREIKRMETFLAKLDGIEYFTSYVGGNTPRFYLSLSLEENNPNQSQIILMTKEGKREEVIKAIKQELDTSFPDVRARVSLLQNGPPVDYPVQFRISGPDSEQVRNIATEVKNIIYANPYTVNIHQDWQKIPNERLEIDSDKSRGLGISWQKFTANLQAAITGYEITKYREDNKLIGVEIRGINNDRNNLSLLKDTNVYTNNGRYVPLEQIAHLQHGSEEGIIRLRNSLPTITAKADVQGPVQALDVANSINQQLKKLKDNLPFRYQIVEGGIAESSQTAVSSIIAVLPIALAIMIVIMMLQLHSFKRVMIVCLTAPLGLIGVTATLLLFHLPFGFVAMLGVIALAGMIMRNSIILIDQIDRNIAANMEARQAIIEATVTRFRPIILTAAAAILAMIPLLSSIFWAPMAAAIMGGLLAATVLTIMFVPAFYTWSTKKHGNTAQ